MTTLQFLFTRHHLLCGKNVTTDHFLTCNLLFRRSSTARHDELLKLLVKFLHDSGLQPVPEAASNGLRPDVRLYLDRQLTLLDVSVTHPTAPSTLTLAQRPLGMAAQREYHKKQ